MGRFDGRVALVTGAGRGLGREHALLLAAEGASVVVNDVGSTTSGHGQDPGPAAEVCAEIEAGGGRAVSDTNDVSTFAGAQALVDGAIAAFGDLDVVVNNAGITRGGKLTDIGEDDWDSILAVHVKGTAGTTRAAGRHWRERAAVGSARAAAIVNTASSAGLLGLARHADYSAAKAAILNLTLVSARELASAGVRVNAVCPGARTRMLEQGGGAPFAQPPAKGFDRWNPGNVSPLVAYLASDDCEVSGQAFELVAGRLALYRGWHEAAAVDIGERFTIEGIAETIVEMGPEPPRLLGE